MVTDTVSYTNVSAYIRSEPTCVRLIGTDRSEVRCKMHALYVEMTASDVIVFAINLATAHVLRQ